MSFEASKLQSFCLKTSVVLNLLKEISRSQDLYFRSTNYIFPIVINRKFVLNAKSYWFYQIGWLDLLILSLRYTLPVEIKPVLVCKLVFLNLIYGCEKIYEFETSFVIFPLFPRPIQNVANISKLYFWNKRISIAPLRCRQN